jgi:hypothetical protein
MPQVISRLQDAPDIAALAPAASKALVRKSDNSTWEYRPPALTDQPNTLTAPNGKVYAGTLGAK